MDIETQKEIYINRAVAVEIGTCEEVREADQSPSIRFWQSLTTADRMAATTEIIRRVHIAKGGSEEDLKVRKDVIRVGLY